MHRLDVHPLIRAVEPGSALGGPVLTLRFRVGRKEGITLPKAVREAVGIDEGDEVVAGVGDGIIIRPARRNVDVEKVREQLRAHAEKLRKLRGRREPLPGEVARDSLEEEFDP